MRDARKTGFGRGEQITHYVQSRRRADIERVATDVPVDRQAQRWDPPKPSACSSRPRSRAGAAPAPRTAAGGPSSPAGKTFGSWDPARSSIAPATQAALRTLEWVDRAENLVTCGPPGTGKSHFCECEALGQAAISAGRSVLWFGIEDLGALIRRHRVDDSIAKAFTPILRAHLVIVDDIGLLPISADAAEGLYRLIDAAYEHRSLAISNLHPSGFDKLMEPTIATALVDRLLHHAHVLVTDGDSFRLADALNGKGVTPLPT